MLDTSSLFALLADERRRQLLLALIASDSVAVSEALLQRSASAEDGERATAAGTGTWDDALDAELVELHHTHLPKLADADVIEWDRETGVVTRGPAFDEVEPFTRLLADNREALPDDPF
ncbi:DUF7344 domain-containing protein [Haloarcula litorea]|uniref:DUF7344 domain-containing protein n=1 Tax=Haloarcula litorea TaxID=3032579 RepID=UPI0023E772A3|nr:hypothetical protein [Halomicroarcula sp. GDY20]